MITKTFLLDPGHSERRVGARSRNKSVQEEDLNRYQAIVLQTALKNLGIVSDIYDPINDNLEDIGRRSKGYFGFISLHLNAYDFKEHYTCTVVDPRYQSPKDLSSKIASDWAIKVGEAISNPVYTGSYPQWPKGVMPKKLAVLSSANRVQCPVVFLSEAFFVDAYEDNTVAKIRCLKAMEAGAKVLSKFIASVS